MQLACHFYYFSSLFCRYISPPPDLIFPRCIFTRISAAIDVGIDLVWHYLLFSNFLYPSLSRISNAPLRSRFPMPAALRNPHCPPRFHTHLPGSTAGAALACVFHCAYGPHSYHHFPAALPMRDSPVSALRRRPLLQLHSMIVLVREWACSFMAE